MPALAYIIPAFNAEATIGDTLRSLQAQTRPDWEAVIIDDGSTDGTLAAAAAVADPRVRAVRQPNRGLAGARNAGLRLASAPAVCFLDADDTAQPAHAAALLDALAGHDLAACGMRFAGPGLEDLGWPVPVTDRDLRHGEMLLRGNPVAVGAVAARREAVERLAPGGGLFDESLPVLEDWDAWLRLTAAGARWAPCVERALFTYRLRPGSLSGNLPRMWRTGLRILRARAGDTAASAAARRAWAVRCLARAAARGDGALRDELLRALGPLQDAEPAALAGALRDAFCREEAVPPRRAAAHEARWRERAAALLAPLRRADEALEDLRWPGDRCAALADAAALALRDGRPVALYGMGRNAHRLLEALEGLPLPTGAALGWVDDDPRATPPRDGRLPLRRLRDEDLTPAHTVIVTPDLHGLILRRLERLGIRRPVTGEAG